MRTRTALRRSIALTAATALLGGGLAALAGPAFALPTDPPQITSFSPATGDNRSIIPFTVNGYNFINGDVSGSNNDYLLLDPVAPDSPNEVLPFKSDPVDTETPPNTHVIHGSVSLVGAPPGNYHLKVCHTTDGNCSVPSSGVFNIFGFGPANATGVAFGPNDTTAAGASRGNGPIDITGSNIAVGAKVQFLKNGTTTPDTGMAFTQGDPGNADGNAIGTESDDGVTGTGYRSLNELQGNVTAALNGDGTPAFVPGVHQLRVLNTDGLTGGLTVNFTQPYFKATGVGAGVSPSTIGQGAQNVMLTVTGQGIAAGSRLAVEPKTCNSAGDVTMGASTVDTNAHDAIHPGTFTSISAPVTFTGCAVGGPRSVVIFGPDGGYFSGIDGLNVGGKPTVTSINNSTLGQGAVIGTFVNGVYQAGTGATITGTGFVADAGNDPNKMTKFSFVPGVTVVTQHVISPTTAEVSLIVDDTAAVGGRAATATNPDAGSSTTATSALTIEAGPQVSTVNPAGFASTQGATLVTVNGTFNAGHTYTAAVTPATGITVGTVTPSATALTFHMSTSSAAPGPLQLLITDTTDKGRAVCSCMGIDSLNVTAVNGTPGATAPNTAGTATTLTVLGTAAASGAITPSSTMTLTRQVDLTGQGPINGTAVTPDAVNAKQATAQFVLTDAAPGTYNMTVVLDPGAASPTVWNCTGCFTISGAGAITVSAMTPNAGGQGAHRTVTITGTNFAHGMQVAIANVPSSNPTYVNHTTLTLTVDVPADATPADETVTVTSGDGSGTATGSKATTTFTVNAAPVAQSISPASFAQGAGTTLDAGTPPAPTGVVVHVAGTGIDAHPTLDLGAGITATMVPGSYVPDCPQPCLDGGSITGHGSSFDAKIVISEGAAAGKRDVLVTNSDGGPSTLAGAFTVLQGPKVTSVANEKGQGFLGPDGVKHSVSIIGTGFTSGSTALAIAGDGLTVENVVVASATKITADITVATNATLGFRTITVSNSAADKGVGTCATCFGIAKVPSVPLNLHITPGGRSLIVTWSAPASTGGAPVIGYKLTWTKAGQTTPSEGAVGGSTLTDTILGLTNGTSYTVTVAAVNGVGAGPAATGSGIAGLVTTLTNVASTTAFTFGGAMTFSGKLMSGTTALNGRLLSLRITPQVGAVQTKTVSTSTTGVWSYLYKGPYSASVRVSFAGDTIYRSVTSSTRGVAVRTRLLETSPAPGSSSAVGTTLKIVGTAGPNKSGRTVYLYRYINGRGSVIARAVVNSRSTFVFLLKPARGTYVLKFYIGVTPGNAANYSSTFSLKRV